MPTSEEEWLRARCSVTVLLPIAAMRAKSLVAKRFGHQLEPQIAEAKEATALVARLGKRVARQARDDDVKGIHRIATMGGWIGEERYQFVESEKGIRIAMRQNYRQWRVAAALLVNDMKLHAIGRHQKVVESIEQRLLHAPVEMVAPVVDQFVEVRRICSGAPIFGIIVGMAAWQAGRRQASM